MNIAIRRFQPTDITAIEQITIASFEFVSIDRRIESTFGNLGGRDWRWRKARQVVEELGANPQGCFVAESEGKIVGYITTMIDPPAGRGRIPNLAVAPETRSQGLGRKLIEHALDYFRQEGLAFAMIETLTVNEVGQHLYPSCGFVEVARQIHYAMKL